MLLTLRVVFGLISVAVAAYGLITQNFEYQSFMLFFLSLMMLVMGLEEFKKGRRGYGWIGIIVFLFVFFVSLQGFFLN